MTGPDPDPDPNDLTAIISRRLKEAEEKGYARGYAAGRAAERKEVRKILTETRDDLTARGIMPPGRTPRESAAALRASTAVTTGEPSSK